MRVRRFELRLIAVVLTAGWAVAAGLVLFGYRPGGPIDLLVGLTALPAALVAAAALRWPPVTRGDRAFVGVLAIGGSAILVLAPTVGLLVEQLRAGGSQTLLPSFEAAYPWLLALAGTTLFTGIGLARSILGETALRAPRLVLGGTIALLLTAVIAGVFAGAAIANDLALRDAPVTSSRFGPTDPTLEPPACDGPIAPGISARLAMTISGEVDRGSTGGASLAGVRSGIDFRWSADIATTVRLGRAGAALVTERAWLLDGRGVWNEVAPGSVVEQDLDVQVLSTALIEENRLAAEERALDVVEGARARRCRVAVDGPTFLAAFPQARWVLADADVSRWRGELDYWVFGDGQLGQVIGSLNGEGAGMTPKGVLGTVRVHLTATDRGTVDAVTPPVR